MLWGLAGLPFGWIMPSPWVLAGLVACGVLGGVAQLFHTAALRLAPVAVIAPFDYSQLIWAGLLGYFAFGDVPGPTTLLGAVVVAASGVYILWRETRRRR
jgi:drug/metabolite transporter (DMT)-like permease